MQGKLKNQITDVTRRQISDEMSLNNIWYYGNQNDADFLARFFDLKSMPSRDHRYNNAYDDIWQHMVNNTDWDSDWIYSDPRINLMYCEDELYLTFLCMTIHPRIRTNLNEVNKLIKIYNRYLDADGFEITQTDEISGKPIFDGRQKVIGQAQLTAKKLEIRKYLSTAYVNGKINTMTDAIFKDTDSVLKTKLFWILFFKFDFKAASCQPV